VHFTVVSDGPQNQLGNCFSSDDDSVWIPYSAAGSHGIRNTPP
jgi:hypothetical protein